MSTQPTSSYSRFSTVEVICDLHDFSTGDFTSNFSDCRLLCPSFAVLPILDRVLNELLRRYLSSIAFLENIGNDDLPDPDRQRNTFPSPNGPAAAVIVIEAYKMRITRATGSLIRQGY